MRTHATKIAMAVLAASALAIAGVPQAGADGGSKTKIVIKKLENSGAGGKVTSGDGSCLGPRKVSLFRFDDFVSVKIEITHSNSKGEWRTEKQLTDGAYFAKVDAISGCRYAVSNNERL